MSEYRVGNHQPQNVYRDNAYIGVMFSAEDAAEVVRRMNESDRLAECASQLDPTDGVPFAEPIADGGIGASITFLEDHGVPALGGTCGWCDAKGELCPAHREQHHPSDWEDA